MLSSAYTGNSKKNLCGYQVNCPLKFGESLYSKIKQTINKDKQESKTKKSTTTRKRSTLTLMF